jgi:hypothetical protein
MRNLLSDTPEASLAVTIAFGTLVVAVAAMAVGCIATASRNAGEESAVVSARRRRATFLLVMWLVLTGALAASGALARWDLLPPPVMPVIGLSLILSTTVALSSTGLLVAKSLPLALLVGFQAFRLPLELLLQQLAYDGVLPVQMTFDGMNFDIATGISAIGVALWAATGRLPRAVLWLWNLMGLALLVTIVTIAMLSAPIPIRVFWNEPANTIIGTFPYVWLPTVLVQAAWLGHLLVFRRLLAKSDA